MPPSRSPSRLDIPPPSRLPSSLQIQLLDQTIPRVSPDTERESSDTPPTPSDGGGLHKRLTNNSLALQQTLRKEIAKQKYARYGQHRYDCGDEDQTAEASNASRKDNDATATPKTYLGQAQARAKGLLKRKRTLGKGRDDQDTAIDILYENQRGIFFFGIPKYSSNSLLPTDPKPWQNAQFRTSASDIRNAQVPDPSWEWAWKSWYVDMSRDVDEEGWEYSFAFVGKKANAFAWHGNHPWFHSFVRRRRWLRMRRRRDLEMHKTKEKAHELTADYFTIHPKTVRPASLADTQARSGVLGPAFARAAELALESEEVEISNIGDLYLALRVASVDREKLRAIRRFIEQGGDEIFYLGEQMPQIMGMLLYQSSRRQLLDELNDRHEQAHRKQDQLAQHQHDNDTADKQTEHESAARHIENLLKAVHAADEQVKKLEYWSDIKEVSPAASNVKEDPHSQPSFDNLQSTQDGVPALKKHAVQRRDSESVAPSKKSSAWFDSQSQISRGKESNNEDTDLERYTTAPETPEETKRSAKGKAKMRELDGVTEEAEEQPFSTLSQDADAHDVQLVEPVAEEDD